MILGLNEFVDLDKNKHNIDDVEECETRLEFSNDSKVETEYIYAIFKNKNKQDVKINRMTKEKIEHKLKK